MGGEQLTARLLVLLASVWLLGALGAVAAQPARYRFAQPQEAALPTMALPALTDAERAYLAGLPEIRVGLTRPGRRPYEVIGEDGTISGIQAEILVRIAAALGLRVRPIVFDRWGAALGAAERHEVDLLLYAPVDPARNEFLEYTLGVSPAIGALFARAGQPEPAAQARFVVEPNHAATDYVVARYPHARMVEVDDVAAAAKAMLDGRAEYYVGELLPTLDRLAQLGTREIEARRLLELEASHYHFAVRKDWAPLARILNKAIVSTREQPTPALSATLAALPESVQLPRQVHADEKSRAALIERPVWRVGVVRGLSPLSDAGTGGRYSGIGVEYARAIARRLGVGLEFVVFDDTSSMHDALRFATIDVAPVASRTERRGRDIAYSAPYLDMPNVIVARSDAPLYWDIGSLRGKRVAVARDHPLRELLELAYPEITIVDASHRREAMDAVADGRADAAIEIRFFANQRIHDDNDGLLRTVAAIDEWPAKFHFATSRQASTLAAPIDEALAAIPADEREQMFRRWIARDLTPGSAWRRHLPVAALTTASLLVIAGLTAWWKRRIRREIGKRRRYQSLLNEIAASLPGVAYRYRLDDKGRVRSMFVSPNAAEFFGFELSRHKTPLAGLVRHLPADEADLVRTLEHRSRNSGEHFKATFRFQPENRAPRWLHIDAVRTRDYRGRQVWTGHFADVTAERDLQRRLALEADTRHLLLATASRQLRNPTQDIVQALQSIERSGFDSRTEGMLRVADGAAVALVQVLEDMLDAARFESTTTQLQPVPFDLRALIEEVSQAWAEEARSRGLAFDLEIGTDVPWTWVHDPLRLKQILSHLLRNACMYTERGRVALAVSRESDELVFSVRDTGKGIDAVQIERLYQHRKAAADAAMSEREPGGGGLGLIVCRKIAELSGGRIEVQSRSGEGSRFALHLPLRAPWAASGELAPVSAGEGAHVEPVSDTHAQPVLAEADALPVSPIGHQPAPQPQA